uniref:Uncharacterized protein n=1 Tax=Pyrodinium bahamense TaxID=73915 RepID=A0A7S0F9I6_9DINO|mmetsp:Transcript_14994/g.41492  ORF Transcript_14994/g.41492 Transcript_14994/m.41492 type:complete len:199 (+) Transcript_14994:98-694(+)
MGAAASEAKGAAGRALAGRAKSDSRSGGSRAAPHEAEAAASPLDSREDGEGFEDDDDGEPPELSAKEQMKKAKSIVKDFVQDMVRGRRMRVMLPDGQRAIWGVGLARALDALKLKDGAQLKRVELADITEIITGADAEGIETPLNELCATLLLASGETITFEFPDMEKRDTFVMCLAMFSDRLRQGTEEEEEEEPDDG